jgi:hypothetical protein
MNNDDPKIDVERIWNQELLWDSWLRRSFGEPLEDQIQKLENKIYGDHRDDSSVWQRDIDELQLLLAAADKVPGEALVTKRIFNKLGDITLRIRPDRNHARPHFHIWYKTEYQASYAMDTFKRLAGEMPRRYEDPMLNWASRKQKSLFLTWDALKAGKDVRELVLHADKS